MEIGPFRVKGDHLVENEGSWNEFANLLFVDQPVGTGFSYVNTDSFLHELPEVILPFTGEATDSVRWQRSFWCFWKLGLKHFQSIEMMMYPFPFYAGEVNGSFILRGSRMPVNIFLILLLKLSNTMPCTEMYVFREDVCLTAALQIKGTLDREWMD